MGVYESHQWLPIKEHDLTPTRDNSQTKDFTFCAIHKDKKIVYFCKDEGIGLCEICKTTHETERKKHEIVNFEKESMRVIHELEQKQMFLEAKENECGIVLADYDGHLSKLEANLQTSKEEIGS